jgi:uncharacterized membrane protein YgdD (TMEM256/DUF423 family)
MNNTKGLFTFACISGMMAVILGAFGAHALKAALQPEQLESYRTAVLYQFIHTLAMLLSLILHLKYAHNGFRAAALFFAAGILCFSGSIYLLSTQTLTNISFGFLGPVTPVGGLFFITGWAFMAWESRKL